MMVTGEASPTLSCSHLSPLSAPRPAAHGREGSQEHDRAPLCVTESGRLRVEQAGGGVVYVTEDGVLAANGGGTEASCLCWADLTISSIIGVGGQATVHRVVHAPSGVRYALKVLRSSDGISQKVILRELAHLLDATGHVNLVTYHQAFYRDNRLHILMEFMDFGDLRSVLQRVGPLPLPVVACIASQVVSGLESLHQRQIVHRDIKPSNLLLDSTGLIKISDFGITTIVPRNSARHSDIAGMGSHAYMSPERLNAEECGPPCDIWSLGLTIAQGALGVYPFLPEDITFDRDGNRRDSVSTNGRPSVESTRPLLSPLRSANPAPEGDRDWPAPSPQPRPSTTFVASPCLSGASASPPALPPRRSSANWTPVPQRESVGTVVSSCGRSTMDGNPFSREVHLIEFSLMLQDPMVRVDFDKLGPLVRLWHPHWPPPETPDVLRHFVDCCVAHAAPRRWAAAQLRHHPLAHHALRVAELGHWLRSLPP